MQSATTVDEITEQTTNNIIFFNIGLFPVDYRFWHVRPYSGSLLITV
jgi:hypothetical protein